MTLGVVLTQGASLRADTTFVYSSQATIRGVNLTLGTDVPLTTSPVATAVNALAMNPTAGLAYYGDGSRAYRWDPALGSGPASHTLMNDFATGPVTAPIQNMDSASGSFIQGSWYVGSESAQGYIEDIFQLTMSADGSQVVAAQALNLQTACGCTSVQLGGFGDTAATLEGGQVVLYGASTDISGNGSGTSAGRWRFVPATNTFTLLSTAAGGQMSGSPSGTVYTNVGNSVRIFDTTTGAVGTTSLFTLSLAPYDFSEGFNFDFGDAPDSYGSAFHRLGTQGSAVVRVGAVGPDNEAGTLNAASGATNGLGDDVAGVDDEDAIGTPPPLGASDTSYSLTMQCSAGARVAAWIDLNVNGTFDASERNSNHPVTCQAGQATLNWTSLSGISPGESTIRIRASTNAAAISVPTGIASDGEVEDHLLTITSGGGGGGPTGGGNCAANETRSLYTSTDVPVAIGPNGNTTAISRITVPDNIIASDINVLAIDGTHTYINDLEFSLQRAGTSRRLYGPACNFQNDFSFGFDDESGSSPPCPPVDGLIHGPVQSLDVFDGQDVVGEWQLRIRDRFNQDGGSLDSWALEVCSVTPVVAEAPELRLGKQAEVDGRLVTFTLLASNIGNTALEDFTLQDELNSVFGTGNYTVTQVPVVLEAPAGFTLDSNWDGSPLQSGFFTGAPVLPEGESVRIRFTVRVDTLANTSTPGEYSNQAVASGDSPGGISVSDLSDEGLSLTTDVDSPTPFSVDARFRLAGHVFRDTSPASATSHDGVFQAGGPNPETGVADRTVFVRDSSGQVLAVTRTGAGGEWRVTLDIAASAETVRVSVEADSASVFIGESLPYADGPVNDGSVLVQAVYGESVSDVDVGVVPRPTLDLDQTRVAAPGSAVRYAHRYRSPSHGSLLASLVTSSAPSGPVWASRLVLDPGCDERIDPGDGVIDGSTPAIPVVPDQEVCFVVDTFIPARVAPGTVHQARLQTQLTLADVSATGHGTGFALSNVDVTRVLIQGSGKLVLDKSVRNITLGGAAVTSNSARPGHVLEYAIAYRNEGSGPITDLVIEDMAPAFTQVLAASVLCDNPPAPMTCTPGLAGASVDWSFTGALGAGQSGIVRYRVTVD